MFYVFLVFLSFFIFLVFYLFGNLIFYFLFVFGCVVLRGLGGVWMCCFAGVGWRLHGFNKMCIIWVAPPWGLIWLFGSPGV